MRFALVMAVIVGLPSPGASQGGMPGRDSARPDRPGWAVPFQQVSHGEASPERAVLGAAVGGIVGSAVGAVLGPALDRCRGRTMECIQGDVSGPVLGRAIGIGVGAHLGNRGRGLFDTSVLVSVGIGAAGMALRSASDGDAGLVVPVTVVLQIVGAVVAEIVR